MPTSSIPDWLDALIRDRRTIENFRAEVPPQHVVVQAVELACWAPNHKHTQPWRFHFLGPQTAEALVTLNTRVIREQKGEAAARIKQEKWSQVPGWLVLTCHLSSDSLRAEEDYAACCCAAQNLALALWSAGIGTKWSTGPVTRTDDFSRLLGLEPGERKIVGLFSYGYPATIPESRRNPVDQMIESHP